VTKVQTRHKTCVLANLRDYINAQGPAREEVLQDAAQAEGSAQEAKAQGGA